MVLAAPRASDIGRYGLTRGSPVRQLATVKRSLFKIGESVSVGETWNTRGGKAVFVALFCYMIKRDVGHVAKAEHKNEKTARAHQKLYRLSTRKLAPCRKVTSMGEMIA